MRNNLIRRLLTLSIVLITVCAFVPMQAFAETNSGTVANLEVTGEWVKTTGLWGGDQGSVSISGTTITAKVNGSSSYITKVTLTNNNSFTGKLSFDYATNGSYTSFSESFSSGTKNVILSSGDSIIISITGQDWNFSSAGFTLSNISFTELKNADATFVYDTAKGSITADGSSLSNNGVVENIDPTIGVAMIATPASGCNFLGWINDATGEVISIETSVTLVPDTTMTIRAVFINSTSDTAWFSVGGGAYFYCDLNAATDKASSLVAKTIVLMNNGTLPAGDYTIPSGVTLLIPYADNTSAYTDPLTEPERVAEASGYVDPFAYRTLTVPSGVTINCAGNIRVDGRQYSASTQYTGHVYGPYGKIALNGGKINLSGTATLRAYGYITGSGTVTANTGTTVHELFQMADWRGGNNTSSLYKKMKGDSFLVSMFYIQNIESTLVLKQGANLSAHVSIAAGLVGDKKPFNSIAKLVASDGFFYLTGENASVTRTYNGGRVNYKIEGNATIGSISLNLSTGIGSFDMNSAEYVLNLPSNMTIQIAAGTTSLPVDFKLLPGAAIQIDSGARLSMTGTGDNACEMILYDLDDWKSGAYTYNNHFFAVHYSTGTKLSSLPNSPGQLIVNGELSIGDYAGVYSTNAVTAEAGNAALSGTGKITISSSAVTSRTTVKEISGSSTTPVTVDVVPLQATLAGKSTIPTQSMSTGTNYTGLGANHGNRWYVESKTVEASCTENGYTEYTCDGYATKYTANIITATGHADADRNGLCDTCGTNLCAHANTEEIPAVDATCTATGLTAGTKCTDCGTILTEQEEVPALGHTPGAEATCTTAQTCTVCNAELKAALGHDMVTDAAVDATCTEPGLTEGAHCSRCDDATTKQEVVPAKGHSLGEWIVDTEATCTEVGSKHKDCANCDYTETETISALGHNEVGHEAKAPTCTEIGWNAYVTCSRCDYSTYVEKSAAGHDYEAVVTKPTCEADGYTTYTCYACGDSYAADTTTKLGHDYELTDSKAATCTEDGYETYTCKNDASHTYTDTLTKTDHSYEAKVTTDPNCTETGVRTYTCSCGDSYTEDIEALGHDMVNVEDKAATCTEAGYTAYKDCSRCDYTEGKEVIPAGHKDENKDHSCDNNCGVPQGTHEAAEGKHTCDYCGEIVTKCSDGNNDHKCDICGTELSQCADEDKNHKCDVCGTELSKCSDDNNDHNCDICGTKLSECSGGTATCTRKAVCSVCSGEYGDLAAHSWKDATCDAPKSCSVCGETEGDALGHSFTNYVGNDEIKTAACDHGCGATDVKIENTDSDTAVDIKPDTTNSAKVNAEVGKEQLDKVVEEKLDIQMNTGILELIFESEAVQDIVKDLEAKDKVTINVENATPEDVENSVRFDIYIAVNDKKQESTQFSGEYVTVTIDLAQLEATLGDPTKPVEIWYVDENGQHIEKMKHEKDGTKVKFKTKHFSYYEVAVLDETTGEEVKLTVNNPANDTNITSKLEPVENGYTLTLKADDTTKAYVYLVKYTDGNDVVSEKIANTMGEYGDGDFVLPAEVKTVTVESALLGDVNNDTYIDSSDALLVLKYSVGSETPNEMQEIVADVNNDGYRDSSDALKILKYSVGSITEF